jgi:phage terminase large subunit
MYQPIEEVNTPSKVNLLPIYEQAYHYALPLDLAEYPRATHKVILEDYNSTQFILLYGGRGRGASNFASFFAVTYALTQPYCRGMLLRQVLGDVAGSVFREVEDRIIELGLDPMPRIIRNPFFIEFSNGNTLAAQGVKSSSGESKAKLKSLANYNFVWIEEADELEEDDFNQLVDSVIRTRKGQTRVLLTFNPPHKNHWLIRHFFILQDSPHKGYYQMVPRPDRQDTLYVFGTYQDNPFNSENYIRSRESYKETNPQYYYQNVLGYVPELAQGRVYDDWVSVPPEVWDQLYEYDETGGLDFGYSDDPTAFILGKHKRDKSYWKEAIYETNLTNPAIAQRLRDLNISPNMPIYVDSSEPKSIAEISAPYEEEITFEQYQERNAPKNKYWKYTTEVIATDKELKNIRYKRRHPGFNLIPVIKGDGSIQAGIASVKARKNYYTQDSVGINNELLNYAYPKDSKIRDRHLDKPIDRYNHAMDAIRYTIMMHYRTRTAVYGLPMTGGFIRALN